MGGMMCELLDHPLTPTDGNASDNPMFKGGRISINAGTKDEPWRRVELDDQTKEWLRLRRLPPKNEDK